VFGYVTTVKSLIILLLGFAIDPNSFIFYVIDH